HGRAQSETKSRLEACATHRASPGFMAERGLKQTADEGAGGRYLASPDLTAGHKLKPRAGWKPALHVAHRTASWPNVD
ncbi:MAG: hypothetical protein Q8N75_13035, partial [Pseudomonadota bacterium]|nr:hypothetical protein [Pseudomonadota bacterium]